MKIWHDEDGEAFTNSDVCWGKEFNPGTGAINVAKISIRGRFPEKGWGYNDEAHEMAIVVRGKGTIEIKGEESHDLKVGDVVYFAPQERVRWSGELDLIIPCGPAFEPGKHHVEEE
ncbi:DUF861 domain-containing protein [Candidatus Saccharibacteria bacterium]|nr:DUF861 domain-containing protein [Candidatus Saccharibacteria bacterium]